jgi:hypothetical protein
MPGLPRPRESERRARGSRRVGSRERVSKPLVVESQDDESRKKDHAVTFPGRFRQQGRWPIERSLRKCRCTDGAGREHLAASAAAEPGVRAVIDGDGSETGIFEVPARSRRLCGFRRQHRGVEQVGRRSRHLARSSVSSRMLRMFVPSDVTGVKVLAKVLDHYPIVRAREGETA